ncbi:hypothetical protein DM01DRAFT_1239881 [Hesseltinella vesiculosa]|uniref:Uncharacterized protein n=1 Tax=Hesseltinella vesiculosa TaxID=101127 RepID=A0A1X2GMA9_9FUNG|nr:hypothetical protein DM01DRAFT_1239881 [Hesseltinella vesiculosa]
MSLRDNWIGQLEECSIFQASNTEISHLQTRTTTSPVSQRLLVLRGNDLLMAVGSQIRAINLFTSKDTWVEANQALFEDESADLSFLFNMPYKVIDTPNIDFDIQALVPNESGNMLAVIGLQSVVVVAMPAKGFSTSKLDSITVLSQRNVACQSWRVGPECLDKLYIYKALWHPLSESHCHLLLLTENSLLWMFDISADVNSPEQLFDLSVVSRKKKPQAMTISCEDEMDDRDQIATFTLGGPSEDTSGWEPLTVYYASTDGHLYALCPVLPKKTVLRRKHLQLLTNVTRTHCSKALSINNGKPTPTYYNYHFQQKWLQDIQSSHRPSLDRSGLHVTIDYASNGKVKPQGPFVVANSTKLEDQDVTDLLLIRSSGISVLSLATDCGSIQNIILPGDIGGQWQLTDKTKSADFKALMQFQSSVEFLPKASLYETLQFNAASQTQLTHCPMSLVADPRYDDKFYVFHAAGVHAITLTPWLEYLTNIKSQLAQGITPKHQGEINANVLSLVNTAPLPSDSVNPIVGMVVFSDAYLSYSLLCVDATYKPITLELNEFADVDDPAENVNPSPFTYETALPAPVYECPKILGDLLTQLSKKVVIPPEYGGDKEVVVSDQTLKYLSEASLKLQQSIIELIKCATQMQFRMEIQKTEFERQTELLMNLLQRALVIDDHSKSESKMANKLTATLDRHQALTLRMERLMRTVSVGSQSALGPKEKSWVDKIDKMHTRVQKYLSRMDQIQHQIDSYIHQTRQSITQLQQPSDSSLTKDQAANLLHTLSIQTKTVDEITARVKSLKVNMSV